jgi:hypothetical protein
VPDEDSTPPCGGTGIHPHPAGGMIFLQRGAYISIDLT